MPDFPELPDVSTLAIGAALVALVVIAWQLRRRKIQRDNDVRHQRRDKFRNE